MSTVYGVWVTLMTAGAADSIVAGLVRRGFGVAPMCKSKQLFEGDDESVSKIMGVNVTVEIPIGKGAKHPLPPDEAKYWVHQVVHDVIAESGMMYYSLIVSSPDAGTRWSAGNVKLPKRESLTVGPYR